MPKHRAYSGFTLIELLVVVLVVGILAAMALPSFLDQVRKARRADAMDALQKIQLEQAKFRANCPHYAKLLDSDPDNVDCASSAAASKMLGSSTSPEGYYTILISSASITTFSATATATGSQANDNTKCLTFAIDENGPDTSGTFANDKCWRR